MHATSTVSVDLLMDGWDHFALWVGVFAALAGTAAAFAAWRTVVVSERQQVNDRAERRIAQALLVYGEIEMSGPQVCLKVTNASGYPISGVGGTWRRGGVNVSTVGGLHVIPGGESVTFTPQIDVFTALYENANYEIHYTDLAGVRWKRVDMNRPEEVQFSEPMA